MEERRKERDSEREIGRDRNRHEGFRPGLTLNCFFHPIIPHSQSTSNEFREHP